MAKLYVDLLSQPARACALFCRFHRLPVEEIPIRLGKGDHLNEEYAKVNPLKRVPFLVDDDLRLPESGAILSYLARKHADVIADDWYPLDLKKRAKVDAICHWYHTTIRSGAAMLVRTAIFSQGAGPDSQKVLIELYSRNLRESLKVMENTWLVSTPYLWSMHPTIGDLVCACELEGLVLLDSSALTPPMEELLRSFPRVRTWLTRVATFMGHHYADVHRPTWKVARILKERRAKSHVSKL